MEPGREQSYLRRIADLEKQNAELREHVARLTGQVAKLTEQVARLSKNSSNSSKPSSSDIVKPPKPDSPKGPRRQGGQHGHPGANRPPFRPDQIDHVEPLHPPACPNGHPGTMEPVGEPRIHQVAELREDPIEITECHLQGCRCSICGQTVWPQLPPGVVEGQRRGAAR